jgi:hypothetical protein
VLGEKGDARPGGEQGKTRGGKGDSPSGRQGPATSLKEGGKWGEDGLGGAVRAL